MHSDLCRLEHRAAPDPVPLRSIVVAVSAPRPELETLRMTASNPRI